jgi:hypothetical protein
MHTGIHAYIHRREIPMVIPVAEERSSSLLHSEKQVSHRVCIFPLIWQGMHECIHGCIHTWFHKCIHVCTCVCMQACMYGCTYLCIFACIYVWMSRLTRPENTLYTCTDDTYKYIQLHTHTHTHTRLTDPSYPHSHWHWLALSNLYCILYCTLKNKWEDNTWLALSGNTRRITPRKATSVIFLCYLPVLSSCVIFLCYLPLLSSSVIFLCYLPLLSSCVIFLGHRARMCTYTHTFRYTCMHTHTRDSHDFGHASSQSAE